MTSFFPFTFATRLPFTMDASKVVMARVGKAEIALAGEEDADERWGYASSVWCSYTMMGRW